MNDHETIRFGVQLGPAVSHCSCLKTRPIKQPELQQIKGQESSIIPKDEEFHKRI